jgi:parallel beta-helix repeat protein
VLRRNLVTDTTSAPGIWMDYANANSRCTCNVILRAQCEAGGIFMEASQSPNLVDTNIVWATRGNGIYQHDCDELTIANNLVVGSTDAAVRMQVCQGRIVGGRLSTAKRNRIVNNIFVNHARPLAISDPDNQSDYNAFDTSPGFELAAWQKAHKWDAHSTALKLTVELDDKTLTLAVSADGRLPTCPIERRVDFDCFAKPRAGLGTPPGPFATFPTGPVSLRTSPLP